MAEYGEWNRKGAVLGDKTAQKEYGVSRDLIVKGIQTGKLEYREGAVPNRSRRIAGRSAAAAIISNSVASKILEPKGHRRMAGRAAE